MQIIFLQFQKFQFSEIDAALYRRYTAPFADKPQLILKISKLKSTVQAMRDMQRGSNGALIKPEVMEYYEKKGESFTYVIGYEKKMGWNTDSTDNTDWHG